MEISSFSENAGLLAFGEPDGRVRLVDSDTCQILQELSPDSASETVFSCIAWQISDSVNTVKTTKRKQPNASASSKLFAAGCADGSISIFDFSKADESTKLQSGHSDRVSCLRWHPKRRSVLYSGGHDGFIIEWDTAKRSILNRWSAGHNGVRAIELIELNDINNSSKTQDQTIQTSWLVSASDEIKIWNLQQRECVAILSTTVAVDLLQVVRTSNLSQIACVVGTSKSEGAISVWQCTQALLSGLKKRKTVNIEPQFHFNVGRGVGAVDSVLNESVLYVGVVVQSGELLIFELRQDSTTKPGQQIHPTKTIKVVTTRRSKKTDLPVVNCALAVEGSGLKVTVAYKTRLSLVVETLKYSEISGVANVLERAEPSAPARFVSEADLLRLGAGAMTPPTSIANSTSSTTSDSSSVDDSTIQMHSREISTSQPVESESLRSRKRKAVSSSETDRPNEKRNRKEEQLNSSAICLDDSVSLLATLVDALEKTDDACLDRVFQSSRQVSIVRDVAKQLPSVHLVVLMKSLIHRLQSAPSERIVSWLDATIAANVDHFILDQAARRALSSVRQLLPTNRKPYVDMLRLQGKLEIIVDQIDRQRGEARSTNQDRSTVIYRDESDMENSPFSESDEDEDEFAINSADELFDGELDRLDDLSNGSGAESEENTGDEDDDPGDTYMSD